MYKYIHLICIDEYIHIFHNSSITSSKIPSQGLHPCELYVQAVFQIHLVGRCNQFQIMCLKYLLWSVHTPSWKFNHFYTAACSTSWFTVAILKTYLHLCKWQIKCGDKMWLKYTIYGVVGHSSIYSTFFFFVRVGPLLTITASLSNTSDTFMRTENTVM